MRFARVQYVTKISRALVGLKAVSCKDLNQTQGASVTTCRTIAPHAATQKILVWVWNSTSTESPNL